MKNVRAVVLAAGEGTRMRSTLSKLLHLHPISSQTLVRFAVNACVESGIGRTVVVVGYQAEELKSALGEGFEYVYQEKRMGTGDALKRAVSLLRDFKGELVVVPGDAPFITSSMLIELIEHHRKTRPAATVLTALLPDPTYYGRIVRNGYRQIKKIVEIKDASSEELEIKEINSGIYCFDNQRLLPLLPHLSRSNKGGEYYLTDVVELLNKRELRVEAMKVEDPQVVLGVNTPEELKRAWRILGKKR
jgi:bifunctional UDP-N-acetylglucosamine pyrophosphorylase/glucosamine-1-phosphate N-acetyltransferase